MRSTARSSSSTIIGSAAIDAGCDYIHLGQEDLADADLDAIRRAGVRLGISTHTHAELEVALQAKPDYIALGPIYPTILKAMRFAPQGLESDRRVEAPHRRHTARRDRRHHIWSARRACSRQAPTSIAVVTDVLRNPDPEARARAFVEATRA